MRASTHRSTPSILPADKKLCSPRVLLRRTHLSRGLVAVLFSAATLLPPSTWAVANSGLTGRQLLQAQLPANTTLAKADCEQLSRAVTLAIRAHHADAPAILTAALARPAGKGIPPTESKLACTCVAHVLRAAMAAASDKSAALLELASSLYPDCADSLQAAVAVMDDKNVRDGKDGVADDPATGHRAANDPEAIAVNPDGTRPDANAPDSFDPGLEVSGFGVGFGPGFPGSPGFTGSPASGAIALPPVIPNPVTSVTNG